MLTHSPLTSALSGVCSSRPRPAAATNATPDYGCVLTAKPIQAAHSAASPRPEELSVGQGPGANLVPSGSPGTLSGFVVCAGSGWFGRGIDVGGAIVTTIDMIMGSDDG